VTEAFRPCIVVPTFDNPATLRRVVERVREKLGHVVVVDDGSGAAGREAAEALGRDGLAHVFHRPVNGGKGAAVKTGFAEASKLGYTHALQVDADGQHNLDDIQRFLETAEKSPTALVLGCPVFDETVNKGRLAARQITRFWTNVETYGFVITDPMCGFRVYPLADATRVRAGSRMEFDIEIAVKLAWRGVPIINLPTKVRYLTAEQGGVSHFRMFEDNARISWMHTKLVTLAIVRLLIWPWRRVIR
jgi:glycosyltransferase involved in cell wall biosynthesis